MNREGHNIKYSIAPDVVIVGAGLGGISALYHLRKLGLSCLIVEKGDDIGGVWYWNCYPGARTDSGVPSYEINIPECWKTWKWDKLFPVYDDMRRYLDHCDEKINIRKDVLFGKTVVRAQFDEVVGRWAVDLNDGETLASKYLVLAVGPTSQRNDGLDKTLEPFRGKVYHPCNWPHHEVNPECQDVAIIGNGPSAIQIAQTWASRAKSLALYQKSYNTALPLPSCPSEGINHECPDHRREELFESRKQTPSGLAVWAPKHKGTFEVSDKERANTYEANYNNGVCFWLCAFNDMTLSKEANRMAYDFWVRRTRDRISNPRKRDILAPLEPHFNIGSKRPALNTGYYEAMDRDNVDIVDVSTVPISTAVADGIITKDGTHRHHDIIIPAIGFKPMADSLVSLGLTDVHGTPFKNLCEGGLQTFLGIMHTGLPNLFMINGPQTPGERCNVPTCIDVQCAWIRHIIQRMEKENLETIRPTSQSAESWSNEVYNAFNMDYYTASSRWANGGKPGFYAGGMAKYAQALDDGLAAWDNFEVTKGASRGV
ncbi:FAD/NAD(P)-binding domain-containing protein [Aspergillus avenaceus]|uniref:FAD/NAD(P)-binding domain-containing protein n=1 Tax=Aspergillus avenaceus TaxID=36643 RepID=A0A5N6TEA4_ASPAV|nr:FAD/NAD(P)-binding domain-containing protein [Aspergillus avenaceus]